MGPYQNFMNALYGAGASLSPQLAGLFGSQQLSSVYGFWAIAVMDSLCIFGAFAIRATPNPAFDCASEDADAPASTDEVVEWRAVGLCCVMVATAGAAEAAIGFWA